MEAPCGSVIVHHTDAAVALWDLINVAGTSSQYASQHDFVQDAMCHDAYVSPLAPEQRVQPFDPPRKAVDRRLAALCHMRFKPSLFPFLRHEHNALAHINEELPFPAKFRFGDTLRSEFHASYYIIVSHHSPQCISLTPIRTSRRAVEVCCSAT